MFQPQGSYRRIRILDRVLTSIYIVIWTFYNERDILTLVSLIKMFANSFSKLYSRYFVQIIFYFYSCCCCYNFFLSSPVNSLSRMTYINYISTIFVSMKIRLDYKIEIYQHVYAYFYVGVRAWMCSLDRLNGWTDRRLEIDKYYFTTKMHK